MGFSHEEILESIPKHLRQFCEHQDYSSYTPRDHAIWRYIMRLQFKHLKDRAHPVFVEGLEKTGISLDKIPSVEDMNRCLSKLGWRAVVVDGYIPTQAFMEFHSHRILPIAVDIRTLAHILYTPAPDIVHEAAGHAPFIADVDYSEYLQKFGEYGLKALYCQKDVELYEEIRLLSILKEDPTATPQQLEQCEQKLKEVAESYTQPSESALLGRLYWWTVEYGLVGRVSDYNIFGAGLLSSMAESRSCLDDDTVKKIPLTLEAIQTSFDITTAQPQLFVTQSCWHMTQVLEEFADNMAFRKGGAESIQKAVDCETVATCEYSSGLQVSGRFVKVMTNSVGREIYIQAQGPTQLCYKNKQLLGHGTATHAEGFGSPVGELQNFPRPIEDMTVDELKAQGLVFDKLVKLRFLSGIQVKGELVGILREDGRNLLLSFKNCTVKDVNGDILFDPSWGVYDMAVGRRVVSVYGGSADVEKYSTYPSKSDRPMYKKQASETDQNLFALYDQVAQLSSNSLSSEQLNELVSKIKDLSSQDWLLCFELLQKLNTLGQSSDLTNSLQERLKMLSQSQTDLQWVIEEGLKTL